ncbi:GTP cyclohydrolase I [Azospirillum canadense]|uniref:GTP cyclohydrolase I n=1 Tax=Azospirillum canadense TaxID=403962 RepID=UPI0022276368|nr:GTP cyclohydrolase I [Azospirillum canadense]MCW2241292.1 GTP cyclohydrolase I [Azospirillum canadense]
MDEPMGTDAPAVAPPDGWASGARDDEHDHSFERAPAEIHGCDGMILLRGIVIRPSHALWRTGVVHIAFVPDRSVTGVSTIVQIVDANARLFPMQERLTVRIAGAVDRTLRPLGVAVTVEVAHQAAIVTTSRTLGIFRSDADLRREFRSLIHQHP